VLKDGKETCKISLWRDNANQPIKTGDTVTITNLVVNNYRNEVSLSSTTYTTIEV